MRKKVFSRCPIDGNTMTHLNIGFGKPVFRDPCVWRINRGSLSDKRKQNTKSESRRMSTFFSPEHGDLFAFRHVRLKGAIRRFVVFFHWLFVSGLPTDDAAAAVKIKLVRAKTGGYLWLNREL